MSGQKRSKCPRLFNLITQVSHSPWPWYPMAKSMTSYSLAFLVLYPGRASSWLGSLRKFRRWRHTMEKKNLKSDPLKIGEDPKPSGNSSRCSVETYQTKSSVVRAKHLGLFENGRAPQKPMFLSWKLWLNIKFGIVWDNHCQSARYPALKS